MKKIGFIGSYDKTDIILYVARVLTELKQKVLVVDTTKLQKAKYVVPAINPTTSYITEYEKIDVAVGFDNLTDIKEYLGTENEIEYDFLLIDIDDYEKFKRFEMQEATKNYFVTAFDMYSLKRGLEILAEAEKEVELTKILIAREIQKEDNEYLDYLSLEYKIKWAEDRIYFPIYIEDMMAIIENQKVEQLNFRKLSSEYKASILYIVEQLLPDIRQSEINKAIKVLEKGV